MNDIINKIRKKNFGYKSIIMLVSLLLNALVYNLFLLPINLVSGGTNGIATITNYVYGIDPALMLLFLSVACVILSLMYLGIERTMGSIVASFAYPILVALTRPITSIIIIDYTDIFIIVIFVGVLSGLANGLMYKTGYSNGGLPIISQILEKYFKIPIAKSSLIINLIIVFVGSIFFGWTKAIYAIILLYINSIMIDKVLLGVSNNKAFYIITSEDQQIKDYIIKTLGHSVTVFDVKGGFLEKKRKMLLTVIPTREYYRVTEGIKMLDDKVFFMATDSYEVVGGK